VAALPYDVLSVEEARRAGSSNPLSFLHIEKSEIDLPDDGATAEEVFAMARRNLQSFLDNGVLFREDKPCYYVYRQDMGGHVQWGIVAAASVREYETGRIKRHEYTREDKEQERIAHVDAVNAHTGPVFLTYRQDSTIDSLVDRFVQQSPEYDFTSEDGVSHTVWTVNGEGDIRDVSAAFLKVDALYIADGHHRAAAAAAVARMRRRRKGKEPDSNALYESFLAVIFPHNQLRIMDYNRVVRDLNGMDRQAFLAKVGERFDIHPGFAQRSPSRGHEFGLYLGGSWFRLNVREGGFDPRDPVRSLDASILQESLLAPVLGITDPRTDARIDFIGGIRGMDELERLVDSGRFEVAFSLCPATMEQLME
jgi:uncharacterized protein (DUF1015 family)